MNGEAQAGRALSAIGSGNAPRTMTLNERVMLACGILEGTCGQMEALFDRVSAANQAQNPNKLEGTASTMTPFEMTVNRLEQITARAQAAIERLQLIA